MNLKEFKELHEMERLETLLKSGQLIAKRIEPDRKIFFYKIFSFYVELEYNINDELKELLPFDRATRKESHEIFFTPLTSNLSIDSQS